MLTIRMTARLRHGHARCTSRDCQQGNKLAERLDGMMSFVSHLIRSEAGWVSLCIVLAGVSAAVAQAQPGIALPSGGAIYLWGIADAGATRALAGPLPDAIQPGTCHWLENGTLVSEPDKPSCLSYYVYEIAPQDAPRLSLSGHIAFNNRAPDLQYRGLELRGVSGVESCGERDNCDTLYIVGFEKKALVDQAMRAARSGKPVTVSAQQVWNMESLDLVIGSIEIVD